jgi:hypothetical protein
MQMLHAYTIIFIREHKETPLWKYKTKLLITIWQNGIFLAIFDYIFVFKKAV